MRGIFDGKHAGQSRSGGAVTCDLGPVLPYFTKELVVSYQARGWFVFEHAICLPTWLADCSLGEPRPFGLVIRDEYKVAVVQHHRFGSHLQAKYGEGDHRRRSFFGRGVNISELLVEGEYFEVSLLPRAMSFGELFGYGGECGEVRLFWNGRSLLAECQDEVTGELFELPRTLAAGSAFFNTKALTLAVLKKVVVFEEVAPSPEPSGAPPGYHRTG